MVQKSKILGKSSLIFITVGTSNFPFNRLFTAIDNVLTQFKTNVKLIVQSGGCSSYRWQYKNVLIKNFFKPPELIKLIKKADKIIAHAAPGTLYLISKHSKKTPLIVARDPKYQEHVANHQILYAQFIKNKLSNNLKKYFIIEDKILLNCIKSYLLEDVSFSKRKIQIFDQTNKRSLFMRLDRFIKHK